MVKMIIVNAICWWGMSVMAQTVNIYDSRAEPGMVVIELIDDCQFSHKLLISLEEAKTYKTTDWLELLIVSGEWNKCNN